MHAFRLLQRSHESDKVSSQLLVIATYAHARARVCFLRIRNFVCETQPSTCKQRRGHIGAGLHAFDVPRSEVVNGS